MLDAMIKFEKYPAYKDSGVTWIGEIPEGWEVKKVFHLFPKIGSGTTPISGNSIYYENGSINWLQTGDLNDGLIKHTSKKVTLTALKHYSTLKKYPVGSLVIAMYGATIGKLGILEIETTTNQACCVLKKSEHIKSKFMFYSFSGFKNEIISMSYGGGQPNISQDLIKSLRLPIPSLAEQTAIANFLDEKTAKIDTAIAQRERLIELLRERQQIINQTTVTKGLDPTVNFKDSGVEWIGEIPERWEVRRLKYVVEIVKRIVGYEGPDVLSITQRGIKVKDIASGEGQLAMDYSKYQLIYKGDFAMNHMDLLTGYVDISNYDGVISPDYRVFKLTDKKVDAEYLLRLFQIGYKSKIFYGFGQGVSQLGRWRFPAFNFNNFRIPIPSLEEQRAIVAHIETQSAKIEQAISLQQQQIEKLKEYKAILINSAVTGKIKIE